MKYNQSAKSVITWTPDRMGLKISGTVVLQLMPVIGAILWSSPMFFIMYLFTPIPIIFCLYEIFYLSKCRISFEKKTVIVKRPLHEDVEFPLCELVWSATQFTFRGCNIYLHKGKQKIMKISDGWDNYDILMTFPHLHPNRFIELELIKRRNERLMMERRYKGLHL